MNREAFLAELRARLSGLPQSDLEERIAFYQEMIEDRVEEGITEEEAIAGIGTVDSIVEQIMSETALTTLVKEKVKPSRARRTWETVLLVIGSPVWIPLVLAAAILIAAVYLVLWAAVACVYATDLSMAAGALAGGISIVLYLKTGNAAGVFFAVGEILICAGCAILLFFAGRWVTKRIIRQSGRILLWMKSRFVGKEA